MRDFLKVTSIYVGRNSNQNIDGKCIESAQCQPKADDHKDHV